MASCVPWLVPLSLLLVVMERVSGQGVQYTDQQAGQHLDTLGPRGVGLAVLWHERFRTKLDAVGTTLDKAQSLLTNDFDASVRVNLTALVEGLVAGLQDKLQLAAATAEFLGYNNTDDGLVTYMKSPNTVINVGGHFSEGVFTVPSDGLYKILIRNLPSSPFSCTVTKNGVETITSLENSEGYFDVRTRVKLVWLNKDDEIYTTGSTPNYFQILRLRVQTLASDYLN